MGVFFRQLPNRGQGTTHHPPKRTFLIGWYFWGGGGWCANCRNLRIRKRQNSHHPQFCTRDVDRQFVGVVRGFRGLKQGLTIFEDNSGPNSVLQRSLPNKIRSGDLGRG